jgi:hypothetical protein
MHERSHDRSYRAGERRAFDPLSWLSTEDLENELMAGIQTGGDEDSPALAIIDEYFSGDDEFEHESEHRRVLLWLLSFLRPHLANLLGGPPAE